MYSTKYRNVEYCFYDDYMTVAGAPIRYSEMTDITHKGGDVPSFAFTYGDRRFTLPYDPVDQNKLVPYFLKANRTESVLTKAEVQESAAVEEAPVYEEPAAVEEAPVYEEPVYEQPAVVEEAPVYEEPEVVEEAPVYEEPAAAEEAPVYEEPAAVEEAPAYEEPAVVEEAPAYEEPAVVEEAPVYEEPEAVEEAPVYEEPATAEEAPVYEEPAVVEEAPAYEEPAAAEDTPAAQEAVAKSDGKIKGLPGKIKSLPRKTLIICAIVAAAIIVCILLFTIIGGGGSVEGINDRVKAKTVTTDEGEEFKVAVVESDIDIEKFAPSYYDKCFNDGETVHWIINKKNNETILISDNDGTVIVCKFDHVDGEEEDPNLLGSGELKDTWIYYPESGEFTII